MVGDTYTIPLEQSYLHAGCDRIGADATKCHYCGDSNGLIAVAKLFNRKQENKPLDAAEEIA